MSAMSWDFEEKLQRLKSLAAEQYDYGLLKRRTLKVFLALPDESQREALASLTDRERQVFLLRFGLQDGRRHTLKEIGQVFGLSSSRIHQIEKKALRKLRRALGLWRQTISLQPAQSAGGIVMAEENREVSEGEEERGW